MTSKVLHILVSYCEHIIGGVETAGVPNFTEKFIVFVGPSVSHETQLLGSSLIFIFLDKAITQAVLLLHLRVGSPRFMGESMRERKLLLASA
jgi:hypothetical protein